MIGQRANAGGNDDGGDEKGDEAVHGGLLGTMATIFAAGKVV